VTSVVVWISFDFNEKLGFHILFVLYCVLSLTLLSLGCLLVQLSNSFFLGSKHNAFYSCSWSLLSEFRNQISLVCLVHAACVLGP
jgi:uncharacterized Tic20 family protein